MSEASTASRSPDNDLQADEGVSASLASDHIPGTEGPASVLGTRRPRVKKLWQQRFVKLLVIGDSGLGKTTLIRSLLAVPGEQVELHDGSETLFSEFQKDPDQFLSSVSWEDPEDHIKWIYQIQDTPGYGDDLNLMTNINRVKQYLHNCNQKWLDMETSAKRSDMAEAVDPRVDLVIFCLPPHRLRNIDLLFMWEISQIVPILPCVMKGDTMTIQESAAYRSSVHRKLEHPGLPGRRGPVLLFSFHPDTMTDVGCPDNAVSHEMRPPYLVVCSNDYNRAKMMQEEPELWPERRYMWGTSEAYNPKHSDLLLLRRLLLQEGVEEIFLSKKKRYEAWRRRQMSNRRPFRSLGKLILKTAITAAFLLGVLQATGTVDVKQALTKTSKAVQENVESVLAPGIQPLIEEEETKKAEQAAAKAAPVKPPQPKTFSLFR